MYLLTISVSFFENYLFRSSAYFLKIDFIFQSSFRFTTKLRRRYRDFSYYSCPCIYIAFPTIKVPHKSGTFVTIDESTFTHHHHPKSQFTLGFTLGVIFCMGFDKCIMTCIYHYKILQSSFTILKILYTLPTCSSLPQSLATIDPFTVSTVLPFPECHVVESYGVQPFQIVSSTTKYPGLST